LEASIITQRERNLAMSARLLSFNKTSFILFLFLVNKSVLRTGLANLPTTNLDTKKAPSKGALNFFAGQKPFETN
jgi:hypothetical protein